MYCMPRLLTMALENSSRASLDPRYLPLPRSTVRLVAEPGSNWVPQPPRPPKAKGASSKASHSIRRSTSSPISSDVTWLRASAPSSVCTGPMVGGPMASPRRWRYLSSTFTRDPPSAHSPSSGMWTHPIPSAALVRSHRRRFDGPVVGTSVTLGARPILPWRAAFKSGSSMNPYWSVVKWVRPW